MKKKTRRVLSDSYGYSETVCEVTISYKSAMSTRADYGSSLYLLSFLLMKIKIYAESPECKIKLRCLSVSRKPFTKRRIQKKVEEGAFRSSTLPLVSA